MGLALALPVVFGACGGDLGAPPSGAIVIEMGNFSFTPATIRLRAGERATVRLHNPSNAEHDFFVGQQPDPANARYAVDLFQGVEVEFVGKGRVMRGGSAFRAVIPPVAAGQLTFTVPDRKGVYEIGCFLPGHYQGGMKGTLVVE